MTSLSASKGEDKRNVCFCFLSYVRSNKVVFEFGYILVLAGLNITLKTVGLMKITPGYVSQ